MSRELLFTDRQDFREWLIRNSFLSNGIWIVFQKGLPLTAAEALEEALCFGWIDGLIKNIDENKYAKYFSKRTDNSKWSAKNKKLVMELKEKGLVTEQGLEAIKIARKNGMWDTEQKVEVTEEKINDFRQSISVSQKALDNYDDMSPSVKKTYVLFYLDAKKEDTRRMRLAKIIDRLEKNLKPM